jgi:hypothetical protein
MLCRAVLVLILLAAPAHAHFIVVKENVARFPEIALRALGTLPGQRGRSRLLGSTALAATYPETLLRCAGN